MSASPCISTLSLHAALPIWDRLIGPPVPDDQLAAVPAEGAQIGVHRVVGVRDRVHLRRDGHLSERLPPARRDGKSTRLNSSHLRISSSVLRFEHKTSNDIVR